MNVPQSVQDALVGLEITFLTTLTGIIGTLGWFVMQFIRQRTQSLAIATGMQIGGDAAYRKMVSASKDGHGYAECEKMGIAAGQQAVTDAGSPTVNAMGEQAVGAIVHAGLGAALKADPGVTIQDPSPHIVVNGPTLPAGGKLIMAPSGM